MRSSWRDAFYQSRGARRGLLLLLLLLLTGGVGWWWRDAGPDPVRPVSEADRERYEAFCRSLREDSARRKPSPQAPYAVPEQVFETFYFDPNTADSTELLRLGLRPWQVRNLYKYRARGGRYHRPEDFARLYGMTGELYERLRPYIRIAERYRYLSDVRPTDTSRIDTMPPARPTKFRPGVRLDINVADTADLQRIPGVGPALARRIVRYRDRLGGFARVEQLDEIEGLPTGVSKWFFVHRRPARRLNLNRLSLDALMKHPYLTFYQSRIIVEHRRKYGPLQSLDDLALYDEFGPADMARLRPYVCFERAEE